MDALAQVASSQREAINDSKVASIDHRINAFLALKKNQVAVPSYNSSIDSNEQPVEFISCINLPYDDHTYAAPIPILKEESNNLSVLADSINSISYIKTPEKTVIKPITKRQEHDESITRCICGFKHDDGYMICCDKCSVWQHVDCMQLDKNNIPDEYLCESCFPRALNKYRAIQLQKKKILLLDSVTSAIDSTTETEDETQPPIQTALDKLASAALLNGDSGKFIKGKKRLKKKFKKNAKDDLEITLIRGNPLKKHVKYNKKITNKTKKYEKIKNTIKQSPKKKISKYRMRQDTYEEASVNTYNSELLHLDFPDSEDISTMNQFNICEPLCRVSTVTDNLKGLNLVQGVQPNEIIIEYRGKVMYEKTYNVLPAKERKSGYVLHYKLNGKSICINTSSYANDARFIRRSCSPNSKIIHKFENGCIRFFVCSSEMIENTKEITIPFDHKSFESKCACSSPCCLVRKNPISPTRKTRNVSLSESKNLMTPKRIQKELKNEVKSPDDQQAIDALLTLAHAVRTPKLCIDDIIQVSEETDVRTEPIIDTHLPDKDIGNNVVKAIKVEKIDTPVSKDEKKDVIKKEDVVKNKIDVAKIKKEELASDCNLSTDDVKPNEKNATKSTKDCEPSLKDVVVKTEKTTKVVKEPKTVKSVQLMSAPSLPTPVKRRRSRHSNELLSHKRSVSSDISSADEHSDSGRTEDHKLTREERKLQAIVKQFEQMENKEHKHRSISSRTSSRKASKEVVESIEEFKPDSKTRHKKHKRRKNRQRSTNSTSSITSVLSDTDNAKDIDKNDFTNGDLDSKTISELDEVKQIIQNKLIEEKESVQQMKLEVSNDWLSNENIKKDSLTINNTSVGSAKKRWLRQAMIERQDLRHSHELNPSIGNNVDTPFITPLKKRRINSDESTTSGTVATTLATPLATTPASKLTGDCDIHFPDTPPATDDAKLLFQEDNHTQVNNLNQSTRLTSTTSSDSAATTTSTMLPAKSPQSATDNHNTPLNVPSTTTPMSIISKPMEPVKKKVSLAEYRKRIRLPSCSSSPSLPTTPQPPLPKTPVSAIKPIYNKPSINNTAIDNSLNLSSISIRADIEFDHISGDADNENLQYYKAYNQYPEQTPYQDRKWQHISQRRFPTPASNSSYTSERPP